MQFLTYLSWRYWRDNFWINLIDAFWYDSIWLSDKNWKDFVLTRHCSEQVAPIDRVTRDEMFRLIIKKMSKIYSLALK